jgi:hypothetical protein
VSVIDRPETLERLFEKTEPLWVLTETLKLLQRAVTPEEYRPIDLYVAMRTVTEGDDLSVRRAFVTIRHALKASPPPEGVPTHDTLDRAEALLERAIRYAMLRAAGISVGAA